MSKANEVLKVANQVWEAKDPHADKLKSAGYKQEKTEDGIATWSKPAEKGFEFYVQYDSEDFSGMMAGVSDDGKEPLAFTNVKSVDQAIKEMPALLKQAKS